jgi:tight adherence protein C
MNHADLLAMAGFALMLGLAVGLAAWVVSRSAAVVPPEDREFKDPPPWGFRIAWWPVQWISHYLERLLSEKYQLSQLTRLRQAGLEFAVSPAQLLAGRVLCAALLALAAFWLLGWLERAGRPLPAAASLNALAAGALLGWLYPAIWVRDRIQARRRELLKAFPFFLDITTLCVEAGLNLQGALNQAVAKGPKGSLRDELQRVQRDIRAGKARAEALRAMAERLREPAITNFTIAVVQAESLGMNLGPVLRAQADQRRTERFLRAEKRAMEAPVKLLFPLIAFIFPCTFVVLFFPIVVKFMKAGL